MIELKVLIGQSTTLKGKMYKLNIFLSDYVLRRPKLCTFFFATQKLLLRPFGGGFWEMCNNTPSNEDQHTDSDNA